MSAATTSAGSPNPCCDTIFTNFNADAEGVGPDKVIERLIEVVPETTSAD